MKGPQLEPAKVLHAFVSRLASCSMDPSVPSKQLTAGLKRSRTGGNISILKRTSDDTSSTDQVVCPGSKQLPCFLESAGSGCKAATFSLPCLDLAERKNKFVPASSHSSHSSEHQEGLQQQDQAQFEFMTTTTATSSLAGKKLLVRPMRYNKLDISQASITAHTNFCSTFRTMVDDRLRRTALTLLQRSMILSKTEGMDELTAKVHAGTIRSLLPSKSGDHAQPIEITASVTNWVTAPPKEDASSSMGATATKAEPVGKTAISQPVVFEAVLDLSILGSATSTNNNNDKTTLRFSVPGTVSAVFSRFTSRIETVQIQLDSDELISILDVKCCEVVHKVVQEAYSQISSVLKKAAATATTSSASTSVEQQQEEQNQDQASTATSRTQLKSVENQMKDNDNDNDDSIDLDRRMMPPPPPRPPSSTSLRAMKDMHSSNQRPKIAKSFNIVSSHSERPAKRARLPTSSPHTLHAAITA